MYEVQTEPTGTDTHLDGLKEHALRDPEKLAPGSRVIFGHVPTLGRPDLDDHHSQPYGQLATVTSVELKTFADLHPRAPHALPDDEPKLVIFYETDSGYSGTRYASDSGVVPYGNPGSQHYNSANFTVLISELKDQGLNPLLTVSESYSAALEIHNSQVRVYEPDWDYGY